MGPEIRTTIVNIAKTDKPTTANKHPAKTKFIVLWIFTGKSSWLTFTPTYNQSKWIGIHMTLLINSFNPVSMAKVAWVKGKAAEQHGVHCVGLWVD